MAENDGDNFSDWAQKEPELVASTRTTYSCSIAELWEQEREHRQVKSTGDGIFRTAPTIDETKNETNYFKSMQW